MILRPVSDEPKALQVIVLQEFVWTFTHRHFYFLLADLDFGPFDLLTIDDSSYLRL